MKQNPEVTQNEGLMNMKMRDVMAIVQGYVNQSVIDNMRKKNIEDIQVNVDLNNTF